MGWENQSPGAKARRDILNSALGFSSLSMDEEMAATNLAQASGIYNGMVMGVRAGDPLNDIYVKCAANGVAPFTYQAVIATWVNGDNWTAVAVSGDVSANFTAGGTPRWVQCPITGGYIAQADGILLVLTGGIGAGTLPTLLSGPAGTNSVRLGANPRASGNITGVASPINVTDGLAISAAQRQFLIGAAAA